MSNLLSTLLSSTNALRALDQALNVVQNNVANASTPGYAKQVQSLTADPFSPEAGLSGGVSAGAVVSRRSEYVDAAVRRQQSALGYSEQRTADLQALEPIFAPIANAGIPGALSDFFQSFVDVSVTPNSTTARQVILGRAEGVAQAFRETATGIESSQADVDRQLTTTVDTINALLDRIREFNIGRRNNAETVTDAGVDANLHSTLEELSQLADVQTIETADHSITVLLGGSKPVVMGDHVFHIQADRSTAAVKIENTQGEDITSSVKQGKLGALLETRNTTLPGYLQSLNTLATNFAAAVNTTLRTGIDQDGVAGIPVSVPPAPPTSDPDHELFGFDSTDPNNAAASMRVNPITTRQLALADGSAGGSGNALNIAALANSKTVPALDGFTVTEYFGNIGAIVGRDLNAATETRDTHASLLAQAQNLRQDIQGVSLDEEAAAMMTYQKGYQASARIISVIDELTQTILDIIK